MYQIYFERTAEKKLLSIPPLIRKRIISKILALADNPRPKGCMKLTNFEDYRIRIGDYRVIYTIEDKLLKIVIIKVDHRKQIYR
jgi:mRNA interferase RelE/StbE